MKPLTDDEMAGLVARMDGYARRRYMLATDAWHKLGDLSRPDIDPDDLAESLCELVGEVDGYYVGSWVEGFGFFNVLFPKETTRNLTSEEAHKVSNMRFAINSQIAFTIPIEPVSGNNKENV